MPSIKQLSATPKINPELLSFLSSGLSQVKNAQAGGLPWYVYAIAIIVLICVFVFLNHIYWKIESTGNIRSGLRSIVKKFSIYGDQKTGRKGLKRYLDDLKAKGVDESHFALTNFFVCSANSPAIFTPMRNGFVSPDAIRLNIAAGARYLDIPVYRGKKSDDFRPYVMLTEPGSNWRRITMNSLPLDTIIKAIVENGLSNHRTNAYSIEAPYINDPMFLMIRFMDNPKYETFSAVAKVLGDNLESHRLDFYYNNASKMEELFKQPITQFMNKVIIMSNVYAPKGNAFGDYINIGPRGASPLELTPQNIFGIPDSNAGTIKMRIQQNLTVVRPPMEEPNGDVNNWDWAKSHAVGAHFAAVNFWSQDDNLEKYRKPDVFGVNSFLIKPANLRYVIEYTPPPNGPSKELDAGDGKPKAVQPLLAPG